MYECIVLCCLLSQPSPSSDQVKVWFKVMVNDEQRSSTSVRVAKDIDVDEFVKVALKDQMVSIPSGLVSVKEYVAGPVIQRSLLVSELTTTEDHPLLLICHQDEGVYMLNLICLLFYTSMHTLHSTPL